MVVGGTLGLDRPVPVRLEPSDLVGVRLLREDGGRIRPREHLVEVLRTIRMDEAVEVALAQPVPREGNAGPSSSQS